MELPKSFSLSQNYPNPLNRVTKIGYALPRDYRVTLEVYNVFGRRVAILVDGNRNTGYKVVTWDINQMASGVYFYKLRAGDFVQTKMIVLLR